MVNNSDVNVSVKSGVDLNNLINGNDSQEEIMLNEDYVFNLSKEWTNTEGIKINRSMTIDGQGHTIDGINFFRVFDIEADNVILSVLAIIHRIH